MIEMLFHHLGETDVTWIVTEMLTAKPGFQC
jgi:hypothetical protein